MATTITKTEKLVGKRIRRREDPRLITGTATYVDDIKMPGMHYAAIVRSPHAAAKIRSIDISKAAAHHGRRRGLHRQGHRERRARCRAAHRCPGCACRTITCWRRIASTSSAIRWRWWSRPTATSRATRAELIEVDYEPLPAVADPEKALAPGAPAGASGVARQHRVHLPPGRRRRRQGLRRSRRGGEAAHHQPAPDSHCDGNARRGGGVARRRPAA